MVRLWTLVVKTLQCTFWINKIKGRLTYVWRPFILTSPQYMELSIRIWYLLILL